MTVRRGGATEPRRILIIQLQRLGDVILTAGLLEDIRRELPSAEVDFLVGPAAAALLLHHPAISKVIVLDHSQPWRTAFTLRSRRYDWVIDAQSSPRTAILGWLSGAPVRAGFAVVMWQRLYTHTLPRVGVEPVFVGSERQRFLEILGLRTGPWSARLYLTPEERAHGEAWARAHGATPGAPRVALAVSASRPKKHWPIERFAELALALQGEGIDAVCVCGPGDEEKVERFRALALGAVVVPTPDLRLLLAVLSTCGVLVSGDTGPAHMATALGVPRVTIFGPTDPVGWSPGWPTTVVLDDPHLRWPYDDKGTNELTHPGIMGVSVEAVAERVREMLRVEHHASAMPL